MQCLWRIVYIQHEAHAALVLKSLKINQKYAQYVHQIDTILASGSSIQSDLLLRILKLLPELQQLRGIFPLFHF